MTMIKVISGDMVHTLLPMASCIGTMREAMIAISSGATFTPARTFMPAIDSGGQLGFMPGAASGVPVYGTKILSLHPDNEQTGYPSIQGAIVLFDQQTGAPVALIDGTSVTALRTAASLGLATQLLARKDALSHGIIGTGVQARYHAQAIASARPSIKNTVIWGRDLEKAKQLAGELSASLACTVVATDEIEEAASCDIVSTVTGASASVLEGKWLRSGAHVNLVGSHEPTRREADTKAVCLSKVYVDHIEGALREAGDLLIPMREGHFNKSDIVGEIGTLVLGQIEGRRTNDDITLYKSLGLFTQDLYAAWAVLQQAQDAGIGETVAI